MTKTMMICPMTKIMMLPDKNENEQMPNKNANDNETVLTEGKYDREMTYDEFKDIGTKDMVLYKRDDKMMTKIKWPIETSDIDDEFMREFNDMHQSMEYRESTTKLRHRYKVP